MKNAYLLKPVETLTALRNGQPTPELMLSLSSQADRAITHLLKEFERQAKVVKVLIGDPGDGKSTFEAALFSRMNEVPRAIPIKINLSASIRFKPTEFMVSLILSPELLVQAALALKNITEKDSVKSQEIIEWMKTKRAWHLFRFFPGWVRTAQVAHQAAQATVTDGLAAQLPIDAINDIYEFHKSMQSWFLEPNGTKNELTRCYSRAGGYIGRVPDAPKGFNDIFIILEEFITLYRHLELCPVWAIDEFESIALLQMIGQNLLLSAVRELIDAICAPQGTGCLLIFTTNDGLSIVEKYPALSDRLFSSRKFTLPNIYWEVNNFSIWDTEKALGILVELYELGAKEGDLTCQAVVEVLPLHLENVWFRNYIHSTLASKAPARSRLKHIIVEVFDILSEGSFEEQCQYFDRENSSTAIFKMLPEIIRPERFAQERFPPEIFPLPKSNAVLDDTEFMGLFSWEEEEESIDAKLFKTSTFKVDDQTTLKAQEALAIREKAIKDWTQSISPLPASTILPALPESYTETALDDFLSLPSAKQSISDKPLTGLVPEVEAQTDQAQIADDCPALVFSPTESDTCDTNTTTSTATNEAWLSSGEEVVLWRRNLTTAEVPAYPFSQVEAQTDQAEIFYDNTVSGELPEDFSESVTSFSAEEESKDIKLIKYSFYKATEKSQSVAIELLTDSLKKLSSLPKIGNCIANLRDTGRLDVLKDDVIESIKTQANELATFSSSLDDATEELTDIFTLAASKTRNGESKRNYLGLVNAKRKIGVNFIKTDAVDSADIDVVDGADIDEIISVDIDAAATETATATATAKKPAKSQDEFKKALFNPCYSLGAMRSFAYQFYLQRGHLPADTVIDALVLNIAKINFGYRLAPSRYGVKFIREKNGGIIDLFRQSDVFLSNTELEVSTISNYFGHLLDGE